MMPSSERNGGDFPVRLANYMSEAEASSDQAALQSIGIDARIVGNIAGDSLSYIGLAVRKVELVVPSRQAEQAVRFLKERSSTPRVRDSDWKCSGCDEVNGSEFDACWSCGKPWSSDDDDRFVETRLAQPLPSNHGDFSLLPDRDANLYAPPISGTTAEPAPGDEMSLLIRNTWRGTVLSIAFPPLLILVLLMSFHGLSKASSGQIPASRKQIRRLLLASAVAAFVLISACALFVALDFS